VHARGKAMYGLDGQHQDVDRTLRGRLNQNDRRQGQMEKVRPWCGQPSDRRRLKKRTELLCALGSISIASKTHVRNSNKFKMYVKINVAKCRPSFYREQK